MSLAKRIGCLLLAVLLATSLALPSKAATGEFGSNRYSQPLEASEPLEGYDLEGYTPLMENDSLAVYWRKEVGGLRVLDKRSGYTWGTMGADKPENLNKKWAAIANSMVLIEVYDEDGKSATAGAAEEELSCTVQGNTAQVRAFWADYQVGLTFTLTLAENGLTFSLADETIREEGEYALANVTFAPFFGAVEGSSLPGYVFVPDGCGALVRFLSSRNYLHGYEKRIYGEDLGIDTINSAYTGVANTATAEQAASLPLFGVTHGERQNAFLAVANGGEAYGTIVVEPAGLVCDYTRANIRFVYRQMYEQPVSRVGVGIQTLQPERNTVDPSLTYYFLTGDDAGYVGMAKTYRSLLKESGLLPSWRAEGEVPLRVDFLVADTEKQFIGTSTETATTKALIEKAHGELTSAGVSGLQIGLTGWQKGGLNGYDKTGSVSKTAWGRLSSLDSLGEMWLTLAPLSAREGQFSRRAEGGISRSQSLIVKNGDQDEWLSDVYYLKPKAAMESLRKQANTLTEAEQTQLLIQDMELLYGEYLSGETMTRTEVQQLTEDTLAALAEDNSLTLTRPNAYLFGTMDGYDQVPMVSSQFLFETDTVPFLQIVLSGSAELYAPYTNLNFYSISDRLKIIDYNTCPTYLLTEADNYSLRNTASSWLCSTRYEDWDEQIAEAYAEVSQILCHTRGQILVDRLTPQAGVSVNIYENGIVYVNYNTSARVVDGITLQPQSAVWQEGGR